MRTLADLARMLRELRRRHARRQGSAELTYRELAAATGWSHGIIGEYLAGRVLPPTDRFDVLIRLLGAAPAEQGALATARDRVEESRRRGAGSVPRQLPLEVFGFTGRATELAELDALLDGRSVAVISAVAGTAGVGKTALAVRWAHQVAHRFPDGQLYLDLRGYDPERPVPPTEALAGFLRALGVDNADIPAGLAERAAHYRTVLAGRQLLVVLDNASGPEQVRPLLPGTASCFTLVTSRDDLAGLVARDGARRIDLDMLTPAESLTLLRGLIGPRVDADPAAAGSLAECCAGLPLALRIAAELATAERDRPLTELLADLRDEQRRLDLLDTTGDPRTAVRSVFSWSYQRLSAEGARAFGLLGLHPGRDIDSCAVAALLNASLDEARSLIDELARAHLIELSGPDRYRMHDLLRAYAAEYAGTDRAALSRLFDHYLTTAAAAVGTLFPHDRPHQTEGPGDPDAAARWLDAQRANLVAVAVHAARHGWPEHSIGLSSTLWRHFEVGGHYQEALAVHTSAARAARGAGHSQADSLANLGGIHWWLGDFREARTCFEQSLAEAADPSAQARALARLGVVHERLGEYREALFCLRDALTIYRRNGNRHGEGVQLINIGALYGRLGRYPAAAEHERWAAALFAELGDLRLEGYALGNLGAVQSQLGEHTEALAHLERSLDNCRRSGDRGGEASALGTLGAVYRRLERHPEALDHLHRALALSRETGDRSLETETLNTLGETLDDMGEAESSLARHRAALALTERTGDRYEHARALDGIARALGDPAAARAASDLYRKLGVPLSRRHR